MDNPRRTIINCVPIWEVFLLGRSLFQRKLYNLIVYSCIKSFPFVFIIVDPVDAIAEFIDNSIDACTSEQSCKISCHAFIPTTAASQQHSYLAVLDNGTGMDIDGICNFLVLRRHELTDGTTLGKFGVGAKQAGFYLGNSITVLSKPIMDQSGKVLRFCLNEEPNVESNTIVQFVVEALDLSEPFLSFGSDGGDVSEYCVEMHDRIKRHFQEHQHGTAMVIRLLPNIANQLQMEAAEAFAKKLKDIYHFHLSNKRIDFQDAVINLKFRER
jgi:hypothetical protein